MEKMKNMKTFRDIMRKKNREGLMYFGTFLFILLLRNWKVVHPVTKM